MRSTGERWTLGHRPALDGIRGIAILLVLAAHMAIPGMAGAGALGVTLFFVLSGFLITALLLEEHDRLSRLDLRRFYARRARRLLPALLASTLVVILAGLVLGHSWAPRQALAPVLLYYANWVPVTDLGALSGTWSLAVEEQFYLAWPLLLLAFAPRGRRWVMAVAAAGAAASVATRVALMASGGDFHHIYMGTDSVAFALLAGAMLAARRVGRPASSASHAGAVAGGGLLLAPLLWSYGLTLAAGPLLAAAGGVLLVAAAASRAPWRLLSAPALCWLGQRSYGLYLWHVPLGFLLREGWHWSWPAIVAVMLPASLLLAEASHRWIEQPFRARRPGATHSSGVIPATTVHEPSSSFTFNG